MFFYSIDDEENRKKNLSFKINLILINLRRKRDTANKFIKRKFNGDVSVQWKNVSDKVKDSELP